MLKEQTLDKDCCDLTADLARVDAQIGRLLREAGSWPQAELQLRPGARTWCALEVLDHLRRCGQSAAMQAEQHLCKVTGRRAGRSFRQMILFAIMRSGLRVGVPKALPELHPGVPASFSAASESLSQVLDELRRIFRSLPLQQADAAIFYHPVGGWMNPETTLDFLALHADHHMLQLNRLRAQANLDRPRRGQHSVLLPA